MNIALRRFLHNHGDIATEGNPKPGLCPTLISNDFFIVHSTIGSTFEQFGALYLHSHDDKYPSRPGLEPGTPSLQAPVDTNKPSGPATKS